MRIKKIMTFMTVALTTLPMTGCGNTSSTLTSKRWIELECLINSDGRDGWTLEFAKDGTAKGGLGSIEDGKGVIEYYKNSDLTWTLKDDILTMEGDNYTSSCKIAIEDYKDDRVTAGKNVKRITFSNYNMSDSCNDDGYSYIDFDAWIKTQN